jgi:hypothetical protein
MSDSIKDLVCKFTENEVNQAKEYILQIHWQEVFPWEGEQPKLIFVAQRGFDVAVYDFDPVHNWIRETIEAKKGECPDGYIPMVCDETYQGFLKAPIQS